MPTTKIDTMFKEQRWLYVGAEWSDDRKHLTYVWSVDDGHPIPDAKSFKKRWPVGVRPGAYYKVYVANEIVKTRGEQGPKYDGMVEDSDQLSRLQLNDQAAQGEAAAFRLMEKTLGVNVLVDALQPVIVAYRKARTRSQRSAIISQVILTIQDGK